MSPERSPIDDLKKRLYSAGIDSLRLRRRGLRDPGTEVPGHWQEGTGAVPIFTGPPRQSHLLRKVFLFSILFFVLAVGVSLYFLLGGGATVSSSHITIGIEGPTTIGGGEILPLTIAIQNDNASPLQSADLLIEYPEGTRDADDMAKPLLRERLALGDISSGGSKTIATQAVLFGPEQKSQDINITVEYRLPNSNAIFYKESTYSVLLSSSPIRLSIKGLSEVVSGQGVVFEVTAESNTSTVLQHALLTIDYPPGFSFGNAEPKASFGNSVWALGDLPVGGKRTITIRGIITGEDNEERVLRFAAGIADTVDEKKLVTPLVTEEVIVAVKRPFISATLALNGDTGSEYDALPGRGIRADVTLTNNLSVSVADVVVEVVLQGAVLDKASITADRGFYQSSNSTVRFDKTTNNELASLLPGDTRTLSFTFASQKNSTIQKGQIGLAINVRGSRFGETNVPESIRASIERSVQIASDLALTPRAVYFIGPFANKGPIPPKAEEETTYTILWALSNTANDVTNATVSATLPPYVRYLGVTSPVNLPAGETLQFNQIGGTIVWTLPRVMGGTGFGSAPREVAFQIALTPSVSQVGTPPILVGEAAVRGFDQFTGTSLTGAASAVTTELRTDPNFQSNQAAVTN